MATNSEQLEALRWFKFPVLNDGHVCLVDAMGDDFAVVQAARVSYGEGTKHVSDDETLIRYLMRRRHTTPFEMVELKFRIRCPMDMWRQWIRHRTASVNEYSTRYSEAIDSRQTTPPNLWRSQDPANKQGSGQFLPAAHGEKLTYQEARLHALSDEIYRERLGVGVAREQARKDLPLSTYTEAYWKINLHNLLHFLSLRMDSHAQWEIRQYATIIGEHIVKHLFPMTWAAFLDYRLYALTLTARDLAVIKQLVNETCKSVGPTQSDSALWGITDFRAAIEDCGFWPIEGRCRERDECITKLISIGLLEAP